MMQNPNNDAVPGDILSGHNNRNIRGIPPHYIIYLGVDSQPDLFFLGGMLTTSAGYGNIPLHSNHFEIYDQNGHAWKITFHKSKGSFLVNQHFYKLVDWQPFTKVGQLSSEGLKFVREKIQSFPPTFFPYNAP